MAHCRTSDFRSVGLFRRRGGLQCGAELAADSIVWRIRVLHRFGLFVCIRVYGHAVFLPETRPAFHAFEAGVARTVRQGFFQRVESCRWQKVFEMN